MIRRGFNSHRVHQRHSIGSVTAYSQCTVTPYFGITNEAAPLVLNVSDGRVTVSIVVIAIATCVQAADYLNSGKPITANSLVQKPVMGKLLQFPSIKKSRKAVRVGVAPKKVARVLAMAA